MTNPTRLLRQVRSVTRSIEASTDNAEHKALLALTDMLLNQLMVQEDGAFYATLLQDGHTLLREGAALAAMPVTGDDTDTLERAEMQRIGPVEAGVERLLLRLAAVMDTLDEGRSAAEKDWCSRVTQWESRFHRHTLRDLAPPPAETTAHITRERLQAYLRRRFPEAADVSVGTFVTLSGGISKQTILFETDRDICGARSMVIRAEEPVNLLHFDGSDVTREFFMIRLMQQHGMPVAEALWLEPDAAALGVRFLVSRRAPGKPIGGNFGPYQPLTPGQRDSFLTNFFRLHAIRPDPADPLVQQSHLQTWMHCRTVHEASRFHAAEYLPRMIARAGIATTPEMLRAMRWLEHNAPPCDEPPVIIHFDFAFNNMIFDGDRMSALLDWETSRLADPAEDFTWTQQNLGLYDMAEFRRVYREGTGRDVSEFRIAWAAIAKSLVNLIAGRTGLHHLDTSDSAPLHMAAMAYKFMPLLGADIDELIARAEAVRGR